MYPYLNLEQRPQINASPPISRQHRRPHPPPSHDLTRQITVPSLPDSPSNPIEFVAQYLLDNKDGKGAGNKK